jgi:hypothetical protein
LSSGDFSRVFQVFCGVISWAFFWLPAASPWGGRLGYLLFTLPEALESVYNHRGKTPHDNGYGATRESGFGKIDARYNTTQSKHERKHLSNDGDNQIRKRNSVFCLYVGNVMGFRHAHYSLRKRSAGVFVPFQHLWFRKGALEKLACLNGLNKRLGLGHEFPSKAFAYFPAGHQKTLLRQPEGCFPSGKTNLPLPATRNFEVDSLNKRPEREKAVRPRSFPLKSHSYLKYRTSSDLFQSSNCQPFLAGSSGFAFEGRPLPGTTFIASKSSSVYKASCEKGLRPALRRRFFTVAGGICKAFAISLTVIPFIPYIIGILESFIINVNTERHLLNVCKANTRKFFEKCLFSENFILTICLLTKTI